MLSKIEANIHVKTCGQSLFDDFIELEPGALAKLQGRLEGRDDSQDADPHDTHVIQGIQDLIRNGGRKFQVFLRSAINSIGHGIKILIQTGKNLDTELRKLAVSSGQSPLPSTQITPHLLMCIDRGYTWTGLHQECVRSLTDDRQLFKFLRCQYFKSRTSVSRVTFRSVKKISLSRVCTISMAKSSIGRTMKHFALTDFSVCSRLE